MICLLTFQLQLSPPPPNVSLSHIVEWCQPTIVNNLRLELYIGLATLNYKN